jgi:hypothetical protein
VAGTAIVRERGLESLQRRAADEAPAAEDGGEPLLQVVRERRRLTAQIDEGNVQTTLLANRLTPL